MSAMIIDGKAIAAELRATVAAETRRVTAAHGLQPGLAVVLVGDNPASRSYIAGKARAMIDAGMRPFDHQLAADVSENDLIVLVQRLNADPAVHGILVQMPLPPQMAAWSPALIPPKTSTAFIRSMSESSPLACRGWCHARRWVASHSPTPCTPHCPDSKPW